MESDPFGEEDVDNAFSVFDGSTVSTSLTGQKRSREANDAVVPDEKRAKEDDITDNLLTFGAATSEAAPPMKTKEGEELEQIAAREKMARRR